MATGNPLLSWPVEPGRFFEVSATPRTARRQSKDADHGRVASTQVLARIEECSAKNDAVDGRLSLSKLTWPGDGAYFSNVLAGLISGMKICLGMVVFANIVFNTTTDPHINEQFSTGVNLNLMAATVTLTHSAVFSSMSALVCPQDVPALVLGQLADVVAEAVEEKAKRGHTVIAAGWICTMIVGCFAVLLGKIGASTTLRKMPAPVTGGFIAAMGATGIRSSLSTLSSTHFSILWPDDLTPFYELRTWAHLGLGFYAFFSVRYLGGLVKPLIKNKSMQAIASPLCLLSPVMMMYVVLLCRGRMKEDLSWMHSVGWMYPEVASKPFYTMWQETFSFSQIDWNAFTQIKMVAPMLTLSALTSLSAVLSIVGSIPVVPCDTSKPGGVGGEVDLDRELVHLGAGQVVAGLLTGFPGYQQVAMSRNMVLLGGSHRLAEFVAVGFVFAVFLSGIPVATVIPKFFLSAVFFNLGFDFCKTYLYDNFGLMHWKSYCSMLVIVFVALWKDLSLAVGVGILMQTYLMVSMASRIAPVYQAGSFDGGFISSRIRTWQSACRLRWGGLKHSCHNKLEVCRLRGPIFFGNAASLEQDVEKWIRAARPTCTHFIMDMKQVTQIDSTGAQSLAKMCNKAHELGLKRVAVAGAQEEVRGQFEKYLKNETQQEIADVEDDLDKVLERYETELLDEEQPENPDEFLAQRFKDIQVWEQIKHASSEERQLRDGEELYYPGSDVEGFYVLTSGTLLMKTRKAKDESKASSAQPAFTAVDLTAKDTRECVTSAIYSAPCAVGLSPFFLQATKHGFHMIARGPATVLVFRSTDLDTFRQRDPQLYITFLQDFCCFWASSETNQLRWRCALNQ